MRVGDNYLGDYRKVIVPRGSRWIWQSEPSEPGRFSSWNSLNPSGDERGLQRVLAYDQVYVRLTGLRG